MSRTSLNHDLANSSYRARRVALLLNRTLREERARCAMSYRCLRAGSLSRAQDEKLLRPAAQHIDTASSHSSRSPEDRNADAARAAHEARDGKMAVRDTIPHILKPRSQPGVASGYICAPTATDASNAEKPWRQEARHKGSDQPQWPRPPGGRHKSPSASASDAKLPK
ncbi:hypothetical protein B0A50_08028 [Salinomyces thailandicus]|uniref:Uncharacterized protein n=1 Tax=Salinomyces thailandicus TaxID=706561 RepID=A0A4U0TK96_9PEZI|nr:hypothetical protein B0A50_08028 [Salinomyces thailandica]